MAEHNWPDLTRRFVAGEWPSIPAMSKALSISQSTLQKKCAELKWYGKRKAHDLKVDAKASEITVNSQAQKISKIKAGWAKLAGSIREEIVRTLKSKKRGTFTLPEILKAAQVVQALEAKAYGIGTGIRGTGDMDPEDSSLTVNNTQINLNAAPSENPPAVALDFNEDQLVKLLGPKVVDAGMAGAGKGADAKPGGGRAAKAKARKK